MVEEIDEPEAHADNGCKRAGEKQGIVRWLLRILVGLLGLWTAGRYLLARRPRQRTAAGLEEVHLPDAEEVRYPDGRIEHPRVRFEPTDASLGWILGIGITALALAALMFSLLFWFFNQYRNYQAVIKRSPFPLAPGPSVALPAPPHLEQLDRLAGIERARVSEREAAQERLLHRYGPTLGALTLLAPGTLGMAATAGAGPVSALVALEAGLTIPEKGFVRIPVDQAIDLLANRLPVRAAPPASLRRKANGLVNAGEANSGRIYREEGR